MSSIASNRCDYGVENYICSNGGYECNDDGDYRGYENIHDHKLYKDESYYFRVEHKFIGQYEDNDTYNSYCEDDRV